MKKTAFQKIIDAQTLRILPDGTMAVKLDKVFLHEITTPPHIKDAEKKMYDAVFNPNRVFAVIDHVTPAKDTKTAIQAQIMRDWCKKHNVHLFDMGDGGICHSLFPESGLILPGETAVMGDSHTCTYGALGAFSMGVGTTDVGCGAVVGFFLLKPQKLINVHFIGNLPANVYAKDLALLTVKHFGEGGINNAVVDFTGEAIGNMSMAGRFTISNMIVEAGGTCGMMAVDSTTIDYLWPLLKTVYRVEIHGSVKKAKSKALSDLSKWNSDPGCKYDETVEIDISSLRPLTTINYHPSDVVEAAELFDSKVDQVFIGSCTNGRIEDLRVVAEIFKKFGTPPVKINTIIIPSTWNVYDKALKEGLIQIFRDAKCCVENPSCGPCLGMSCGVVAPGGICMGTGNRNYLDRMGEGGMVHLASPATAAYTAMNGKFAAPPIDLCLDVNRQVSKKDEVKPFTRIPVPVKDINYRYLLNTQMYSNEERDFSGKPFFLPRAKVNTDEIIPAKYLTEVDREAFGKHCLEPVIKDPAQRAEMSKCQIFVSDISFGDGSSREQAPWALEGAGIKCVIAKSFKRIFETNFFNNALLAIQMSDDVVNELFSERPDYIKVVWDTLEGKQGHIKWRSGDKTADVIAKFSLSELEKDTIRKGGKVGIMLELAAELQEEGKI